MEQRQKLFNAIPVLLIAFVVMFFWAVYPVYPSTGSNKEQVLVWMADSWRIDFVHGWAVPVLFVVFVFMAWSRMKKEAASLSSWGLVSVAFGQLLFLVSARTIQPRIALIGMPFIIFGGVLYVYGWKVARHMIFPAFFWYFAVSVPGLQQATNGLQLIVTKSSYAVGSVLGMDLVLSGNSIGSATDSWKELNIAEGCSGIRSLMALVMISAIYAYFTQKKMWKMAFLFACALPLALIANFFRIFTIIVLAEMGYSDFAAGAYHDWAGLLFFFPIALSGLFMIDRLLNWKENSKVVRRRVVGEKQVA